LQKCREEGSQGHRGCGACISLSSWTNGTDICILFIFFLGKYRHTPLFINPDCDKP